MKFVRSHGLDVNIDVDHSAELGTGSLRGGLDCHAFLDRWLSFAELYNSNRIADYNVGAIELNLTPDGKGSGTVLPACRLTINKKKQQVEIETYQNPRE